MLEERMMYGYAGAKYQVKPGAFQFDGEDAHGLAQLDELPRPVPVGDCLRTPAWRPGTRHHRPLKGRPGRSSLRHRDAVSHGRCAPED